MRFGWRVEHFCQEYRRTDGAGDPFIQGWAEVFPDTDRLEQQQYWPTHKEGNVSSVLRRE